MRSHVYVVTLITLIAASSWAAFGFPQLMLAFLGVLGLAAYICLTSRLRPGFRWSLHGLVFLLLIALMLPAVSSAREAAHRAQCCNNLKQIVVALVRYDEDHGHLPPPCVYDKKNRPMHSWRVLILPYLGRKELYDRYRFDEPWDGPNNRKLLAERPPEYHCPSVIDDPTKSPATSYVAVVGDRSLWKRDENVSLNDTGSKELAQEQRHLG